MIQALRLLLLPPIVLGLLFAALSARADGVPIVFDPNDPSIEIGGGAEFGGERILVNVTLEHRGDVAKEIRFIRVSTELGIEKDSMGKTRFRYAHLDLTPVTWVALGKDGNVSLGLVPLTVDSEMALGLESTYRVRLIEGSANFGAAGLEPGFFAGLSAKLLGYQSLRFRGDHDREGAFDYGTFSGDAGYTWSFAKGETLRWKIVGANVSPSSRLFMMDIRTEAAFYLDNLLKGVVTGGWKHVSEARGLTDDRWGSQFYLRVGVGIVITGR